MAIGTDVRVAPGLYAWTLTYDTGPSRTVLASSMASAIGLSPVVTATRGPAVGDGSNDVAPVLTSLVPPSVKTGQPGFTLHVHGTGFKPESAIAFDGSTFQPTTFVSVTELTMTVPSTIGTIGPHPVEVRTITGKTSNVLSFDLQPAAVE